jgi:hypothetical protein
LPPRVHLIRITPGEAVVLDAEAPISRVEPEGIDAADYR